MPDTGTSIATLSAEKLGKRHQQTNSPSTPQAVGYQQVVSLATKNLIKSLHLLDKLDTGRSSVPVTRGCWERCLQPTRERVWANHRAGIAATNRFPFLCCVSSSLLRHHVDPVIIGKCLVWDCRFGMILHFSDSTRVSEQLWVSLFNPAKHSVRLQGHVVW